MKLAELILEDKSSPYADWFVELPVDVAVKATTATLRMQPGNLLSTEWFGGISKFKLNVGAGWRIYFVGDCDVAWWWQQAIATKRY